MNKTTIVIRATALLLTLFVADAAYAAKVIKFQGTRDQVRSACKGDLVEGGNNTACLGVNGGNSVVCYDGGECWGSIPRTSSIWGSSQIRGYFPPDSLTSSSSSSGGTAAPSAPAQAPAPTQSAPPIIIN